VCLKHKLKASAPSLTPWQLLDQFARIQMVEVWFKLRAGGCICLERVTQPEAAQAALIAGATENKPAESQKNAKVGLTMAAIDRRGRVAFPRGKPANARLDAGNTRRFFLARVRHSVLYAL
jgi:hypothetical protein